MTLKFNKLTPADLDMFPILLTSGILAGLSRPVRSLPERRNGVKDPADVTAAWQVQGRSAGII